MTQETFLAAWRAIDRCPPGFEKQWLARIAANKAKDYLRSAWVRRVNTPGDEVLALPEFPEQGLLDQVLPDQVLPDQGLSGQGLSDHLCSPSSTLHKDQFSDCI